MQLTWATGLIISSIVMSASGAHFAHSVLLYEPGTGAVPGYDNPLAALGEPSRVTPGMFGGPVDPFTPPFLAEQVVSVGSGGSLTLGFDPPLQEDPNHPFGLEFVIYGNNGFSITNGDFTGGGITDGTTFTFDPPGASRVWVSEDGQTFHELHPPAGVMVDGLFPTDGLGDFTRPVNPVLDRAAFAGLGLAGIRTNYAGSGGGTGFDLAWATNELGMPICRARYVRIEVATGKVEVDGLSAVAADPSLGILEDFACDPLERGWRHFGDSDLFNWDPAEGLLHVTWDSARTNSYLYKSLGQILSRADNFTFEFDLELDSIAIGTTPEKPYTFQLAVGLINFAEATRPDFFRGSGIHPQYGGRSLVEFNYFPDSGFGATVAPTVVSSNNQIGFGGSFPLVMSMGDTFHINMAYDATNEVLRTTMMRNGQPFGLPPDQTLRELSLTSLADFRVDTLAVASYNDGGQSPPEFAGSIHAQGTVDNLRVQMPPAPVRGLAGSFSQEGWQISFLSRVGYSYVLERSDDFVQWADASSPLDGTGAELVLVDQAATEQQFFYRVRVLKP